MFASSHRFELSALWNELVSGTSKIESWCHEPDTWSMVVSRSPTVVGHSPVPLRARDREILEQTLLSGVRKIVAMEAGLSCSSIAVIMQTCFHFMGLSCLPSRIPGLLVAAAHAHHHVATSFMSSLTSQGARVPTSQSICVPRPDRSLAAWLAPAEHAVISLLVEGQSYAEIAHARHTSVRTVANQVASGFRRLGVSGRAELLCLLARWGLKAPEHPARRPPTSITALARRPSPLGSCRSDDAQHPHLA